MKNLRSPKTVKIRCLNGQPRCLRSRIGSILLKQRYMLQKLLLGTAPLSASSTQFKTCPLLKRMQLTCIVCMQSHNTQGSWGSCQKRVCVTAWPSFHLLPFVGCFVHNKPKDKLLQSPNQAEHTENNCITSQAQNMTALVLMCFNWDTSVTGNKEGIALPSAQHSQGQLLTPQSLSVTAHEHCMRFLGKCCYDVLSCSRLRCHLASSLSGCRSAPRIFHWGRGPKPEDTYSLCLI